MNVDGTTNLFLSPCPFCGGEAEFEDFAGVTYVKCLSCGAESKREPYNVATVETPAGRAAKSVTAWNRRVDCNQSTHSNSQPRGLIPDPFYVMMSARRIPDSKLLEYVVKYTSELTIIGKMFVMELLHRFRQMDLTLCELKLAIGKEHFSHIAESEGDPTDAP